MSLLVVGFTARQTVQVEGIAKICFRSYFHLLSQQLEPCTA